MNEKNLLQIRDFSYLTGISRDNLRFYDREGLLTPEIRGENGYRYYTRRQIDEAYLISDLRFLGVGLPEIKKYAGERSPELMLELLKRQNAHIEAEIGRLRSMQELMKLRAEMAVQALKYTENTVVLEERVEEPIYLCPLLDGSDDDNLVQCYNDAADHDVNISFPIGSIISEEALRTQNPALSPQYYFKVREPSNASKPAGTYAVLYGKLTDSSPEIFYELLLSFIQENNLEIEGNAYGEFLLDELCTRNGDSYGVRVEVKVTEQRPVSAHKKTARLSRS